MYMQELNDTLLSREGPEKPPPEIYPDWVLNRVPPVKPAPNKGENVGI